MRPSEIDWEPFEATPMEEWGQAALHALELEDALGEMLDAALEGEVPTQEVVSRAAKVFLKAKGLGEGRKK